MFKSKPKNNNYEMLGILIWKNALEGVICDKLTEEAIFMICDKVNLCINIATSLLNSMPDLDRYLQEIPKEAYSKIPDEHCEAFAKFLSLFTLGNLFADNDGEGEAEAEKTEEDDTEAEYEDYYMDTEADVDEDEFDDGLDEDDIDRYNLNYGVPFRSYDYIYGCLLYSFLREEIEHTGNSEVEVETAYLRDEVLCCNNETYKNNNALFYKGFIKPLIYKFNWNDVMRVKVSLPENEKSADYDKIIFSVEET